MCPRAVGQWGKSSAEVWLFYSLENRILDRGVKCHAAQYMTCSKIATGSNKGLRHSQRAELRRVRDLQYDSEQTTLELEVLSGHGERDRRPSTFVGHGA